VLKIKSGLGYSFLKNEPGCPQFSISFSQLSAVFAKQLDQLSTKLQSIGEMQTYACKMKRKPTY